MLQVAARCERGPVREANEDACCVEVARTAFGEAGMAVVCDGVGGLSSGEVASAAVVRAFDQWFSSELPALIAAMPNGFDPDAVERSWRLLLEGLNDRLQRLGRERGVRLGTTFTGVLTCAHAYVAGHVGDSRLYHVHDQRVDQVTRDQTLVERQVAQGLMTAEEAEHDERKNVILQAVGAATELEPAFYRGHLLDEDRLVVVSDGAYRLTGTEVVRDVFSAFASGEQALGRACDDLVRRAILAGETDNLSVACIASDDGAVPERDAPVASRTVMVGAGAWA